MRLALLLLTACGRLGFGDEARPDAIPATPDAAGAAFDVEAGKCASAQAGPFVEVAAFATTGGGYGVWPDPPYVLMADTTSGLHALRFDGTAFTEIGHATGVGWVESVWKAFGVYLVSAPGTGLAIATIEHDALTIVAQDTSLPEARRGWVSDDVLYEPSGGSGLYALHFTGTGFARLGTNAMSMSWGQGAWSSGHRTIFADADALRMVDFDGSTFHDVMTPDTTHPGTSRVWSDGAVAYVAHGQGVTAYRLTGPQLTEVTTFALAGGARDVWSDGQHVFVAADAKDGFYALGFDGTAFTLLDHVGVGASGLGIIGDGTYVYTNDVDTGLHAYRGFACQVF